MKILKFVLVFLICVIIAAFAAHNASYVPLSFYPFDIKISVAAFFLVFICVFIGVILAGIISAVKFVQYRRTIRDKNRQIARLEKELYSAHAKNQIAP